MGIAAIGFFVMVIGILFWRLCRYFEVFAKLGEVQNFSQVSTTLFTLEKKLFRNSNSAI